MFIKLSIVAGLVTSILTLGTAYTASAEIVTKEENPYISVREEIIEKYGFDPIDNNIEIEETGAMVVSTQTIAYTYTSVYTPKKSAVKVISFLSNFTSDEISYMNTTFDEAYSKATRLSTATRYYNCHSYAWYCADNSNPYWMNNPATYYTDGSYSAVFGSTTEVIGSVGDILCYYKANGEIQHSAVIVSKTSNSLSDVTVVSKWGSCGLYQHTADYCPYMPTYGGETSYVISYTHAQHTYGSFFKNYDMQYHKSYCNCGSYKLLFHCVKAGTIVNNKANCMECGASLDLNNYNYPEVASLQGTVYLTENGTYMLPSGIIVVAEEDYESVMNGTLCFDDEYLSSIEGLENIA